MGRAKCGRKRKVQVPVTLAHGGPPDSHGAPSARAAAATEPRWPGKGKERVI
jgi:hypothetical protein